MQKPFSKKKIRVKWSRLYSKINHLCELLIYCYSIAHLVNSVFKMLTMIKYRSITETNVPSVSHQCGCWLQLASLSSPVGSLDMGKVMHGTWWKTLVSSQNQTHSLLILFLVLQIIDKIGKFYKKILHWCCIAIHDKIFCRNPFVFIILYKYPGISLSVKCYLLWINISEYTW